MSYPPFSRYGQPDRPEQGYSGWGRAPGGDTGGDYRDQGTVGGGIPAQRNSERRFPGPDERDRWDDDGGRGTQWGTGERRPAGIPQQRYSAPPARAVAPPGRAFTPRPPAERYVPPIKRHTGRKVTLIVLGVLLLLCSGGLFLGARTVHTSYPATVSLPDQLAGLAKVTDPDLQSGVDDVVAGLKTGQGVRDAVAGIYAKEGDAEHLVMVFAAAGFFLRPERELASGMVEFNTNGFTFADPVDVDPGPLGGFAKCAVGTLQAAPTDGQTPDATATDDPTTGGKNAVDFLLCGWSDYGSVGMAGFLNAKDAAVGADSIVTIRQAVESH